MQRATAICEKENVVSSGVYYRLGKTLEKLGRRSEALESYFKALALEDDENQANAAIADLYRRMHGSTTGLDALKRSRVNDLLVARADTAKDLVRTVDEELADSNRLTIRGDHSTLVNTRARW